MSSLRGSHITMYLLRSGPFLLALAVHLVMADDDAFSEWTWPSHGLDSYLEVDDSNEDGTNDAFKTYHSIHPLSLTNNNPYNNHYKRWWHQSSQQQQSNPYSQLNTHERNPFSLYEKIHADDSDEHGAGGVQNLWYTLFNNLAGQSGDDSSQVKDDEQLNWFMGNEKTKDESNEETGEVNSVLVGNGGVNGPVATSQEAFPGDKNGGSLFPFNDNNNFGLGYGGYDGGSSLGMGDGNAGWVSNMEGSPYHFWSNMPFWICWPVCTKGNSSWTRLSSPSAVKTTTRPFSPSTVKTTTRPSSPSTVKTITRPFSPSTVKTTTRPSSPLAVKTTVRPSFPSTVKTRTRPFSPSTVKPTARPSSPSTVKSTTTAFRLNSNPTPSATRHSTFRTRGAPKTSTLAGATSTSRMTMTSSSSSTSSPVPLSTTASTKMTRKILTPPKTVATSRMTTFRRPTSTMKVTTVRSTAMTARKTLKTTSRPSTASTTTTRKPTTTVTTQTSMTSSTRLSTTATSTARSTRLSTMPTSTAPSTRLSTTALTTPSTTASTTASTTTKPVIPDICEGSHVIDRVGYKEHWSDCNKFIQCTFRMDGSTTVYIKACANDTLWDQKALKCNPSHLVDCPYDRCKIPGLDRYPSSTTCRGYWICRNGKSHAMCCPPRHSYDVTKGCVPNTECLDKCEGEEVHDVCNKRAVPNRPLAFEQYTDGQGWVLLTCPQGTRYSEIACQCTSQTDETSPNIDCRPELFIPFNGDIKDESGNNNFLQVDGVKVMDNTGYFDGQSLIRVPRFANLNFGDTVFIKLRYKEAGGRGPAGGLPQALVANGDCNNPSSLYLATSQGKLDVGLMTDDGRSANVSIPSNSSGWKEAVLVVDKSTLLGALNGVSYQTLFTGTIDASKCALQIGRGTEFAHFTGYMDDITVYLCKPKGF